MELSWQGGRLVGKENDIKQQLPFLVKRTRHFWSIFPNEEKLAPTSNSNLETSLRAFLGAQSIGEKGETFGNALSPHQVHIHPHLPHNSENTPPSINLTPFGLYP